MEVIYCYLIIKIDVNFIGELVNHKILSRKVIFQCLEYLLTTGKKSGGVVLHQNLEGVVILLDKFGTTINCLDFKIKKEEFDDLNSKINNFIDNLETETEKNTSIPGHIKFKIINLIEKKNRGWTESLIDKKSKIKSIQQVKEEAALEESSKKKDNKCNQKEVDTKFKPNKLDSDTVSLYL